MLNADEFVEVAGTDVDGVSIFPFGAWDDNFAVETGILDGYARVHCTIVTQGNLYGRMEFFELFFGLCAIKVWRRFEKGWQGDSIKHDW